MQEVKKILFVMPYLGCGGVEATFFSLLDVMDRKRCEITLLILEDKGQFRNRIPKDIKERYIEIPKKERGIFFGKKKMLKEHLGHGRIWKIPGYLLYNMQISLTEDRVKNAAYFSHIADSIPEFEGEYDLAVDYFGYATFTTFYVAEKVHAKRKVTWLHSIFSRFSPQAFEKWYRKMDVIYAVSQMVKSDFETIFPQIDCVKLFYNIIDPGMIRRKANKICNFDDGYKGMKILTVGRLCGEKGIDLAIEAYKRLIKEGYVFRWYVIGGGSLESIQMYKKLLLPNDNNFVFLGIKDNPYVYMRQCDIYVQPSRFEGYCTTTNEARILGCPIVTTDVSGAREQIQDGKTGLIVESTVEGIYKGVKELLDNPELRKEFTENLKFIDCDTRKEVKKIYRLLDN